MGLTRPKVIRKSFDFPLELDARLKAAAHNHMMSEAVLVRTILTNWIIKNQPEFKPPQEPVSQETVVAGKKPVVLAEMLRSRV
jgi:hypothetical protein